jgi:ATP-binding cassette, subfamily B, bacterial IrtA/YbtP
VRIGCVDVRELSADRLYRLVSFVFQDVQLLRASVRDISRWPDATDAEVHAVARGRGSTTQSPSLPDGDESVVGRDT